MFEFINTPGCGPGTTHTNKPTHTYSLSLSRLSRPSRPSRLSRLSLSEETKPRIYKILPLTSTLVGAVEPHAKQVSERRCGTEDDWLRTAACSDAFSRLLSTVPYGLGV